MEKTFVNMRSFQTKENIYQRLLTCVLDGNHESITVTTLINKSQISRSTFYRHFKSIEDVLLFKTTEVVEHLFIYFKNKNITSKSDRFPFLYPTLIFFRNRAEFIGLLVLLDKTSILRQELYKYLKKLYPIDEQEHGNVSADKFYMIVCSNVMVSLLILWFKNGMKQSPEELADTINKSESITEIILSKLDLV